MRIYIELESMDPNIKRSFCIFYNRRILMSQSKCLNPRLFEENLASGLPPPGPKPGGLTQELRAQTTRSDPHFVLYITHHNALVSTLQVLERITDLFFGSV